MIDDEQGIIEEPLDEFGNPPPVKMTRTQAFINDGEEDTDIGSLPEEPEDTPDDYSGLGGDDEPQGDY